MSVPWDPGRIAPGFIEPTATDPVRERNDPGCIGLWRSPHHMPATTAHV